MARINNLEELLKSTDTNGSIIELDKFIAELCSYGEEMDKLNEYQQLFFYNQSLEREINNGGFYQYFFNSSGDFAHQAIKSLKAIGAEITADILQKAIDQFPNKMVPQDRDKRIEIVEQIEANANIIWGELEGKFFDYQDNLNMLNLNFIKQHPMDF